MKNLCRAKNIIDFTNIHNVDIFLFLWYNRNMKIKPWDYQIKRNWKPRTRTEWFWYLERKINYDDWQDLKIAMIKKYFRGLKIDPGKKLMLMAFFKKYGKKDGL
ncbi:MAG: hypothetical protein AB1465_06120 [Patescibacteria group bacterium]